MWIRHQMQSCTSVIVITGEVNERIAGRGEGRIRRREAKREKRYSINIKPFMQANVRVLW